MKWNPICTYVLIKFRARLLDLLDFTIWNKKRKNRENFSIRIFAEMLVNFHRTDNKLSLLDSSIRPWIMSHSHLERIRKSRSRTRQRTHAHLTQLERMSEWNNSLWLKRLSTTKNQKSESEGRHKDEIAICCSRLPRALVKKKTAEGKRWNFSSLYFYTHFSPPTSPSFNFPSHQSSLSLLCVVFLRSELIFTKNVFSFPHFPFIT